MDIFRFVFRALWFVALAIISGACAAAQTSVAAAARTEVRFTSWEVDQLGLFVTDNDRDYTPIVAPAYEEGAPVSVRTAVPLRIYQQVKTDREIGYAVVGETTLPAECRSARVYLVRRPDKDGRRDYQLIALSNDVAVLPAGKVRFFNFTPWTAVIRAGGEEWTLGSLEWRVVAAVPDRKNRVIMQAALRLPEGGSTPFVRDLVTLRENYRGNVTLLHTRRSLDETDPDTLLMQARVFLQTAAEYVHPEPVHE